MLLLLLLGGLVRILEEQEYRARTAGSTTAGCFNGIQLGVILTCSRTLPPLPTDNGTRWQMARLTRVPRVPSVVVPSQPRPGQERFGMVVG